MERVCHACGKHLKDAPAILVSGTCFCFYHAKQEYPIALKRWEEEEQEAIANYRAEMEAYLSRKSQAEAAKRAYDQQCYKGFWRVVNSAPFAPVVVIGVLALSYKLFSWFEPWLATQIGIGGDTPFFVTVLFVLAVGLGVVYMLPIKFCQFILNASASGLRIVHNNYAKIHPEPAPFTEKAPVFQALSDSSELLTAHSENDHPLFPAGSGYNRSAILRRDGFQCQCCGKVFQPELLEVHHVKPRASGGGDATTNLVTLCLKCHLIEDWFGHVHKQRREFGL